MNYCSECGHRVELRNILGEHIPRFICGHCHTIHYENPKMIVGCLPVWEDKVMLCRRGIEPRKGFWNLPAGFMENGETVEHGAKREAYEETGVEVELIRLHCVYSVHSVNQVHLHFLARMLSVDYTLNEESVEISLFGEEEIPWGDIAFESNVFSLRAFFEGRKEDVNKTFLGQWG